MEITEAQYERIAPSLPVQRGNVSVSNLQVLNAILYVAEQGCKWWALPARFGPWHTIYTRMNRWSKSGVLERLFEQLQREHIVRIKLEAVSLDSPRVKVHPEGTGALKKTDHKPSVNPGAGGPPKFIWLPRMPARPRLSRSHPARAHDAPPGRALMRRLEPLPIPIFLIMDRAYEGNETRQRAMDSGFMPVVPPQRTRVTAWEYNRKFYKRRNEVERLFRSPGFSRTPMRLN